MSRPNAGPPPSNGIRGAMRERIMREMVEAVPGQFKILICDDAATKILNSVARMHDLIDHGVTLVENLANKRQPVPTSSALYFMAPTRANVQRIIDDWAVRPMYAEPHLFFTWTAPNNLIDMLGGTQVASRLKSLKDLLIDFTSPESLSFSLNFKYDIPSFFGPAQNPSKLHQAAAQLVSVVQTYGDATPSFRFQGSATAKDVAVRAQDLMNVVGKTMPTKADSGHVSVLVLDRSIDVCTALMHDLSYQAMQMDLMPLTDGVYNQHYKDRSNRDAVRKAVIDEADAFWVKYRHQHISATMRKIPEELKQLQAQNPQLAGATGGGRGGDPSLTDLGDAVRALPQYQEKEAKLSMHVDMATELFKLFQVQNLRDTVDIEQRLATGENADGTKPSFKDLYDSAMNLAKDATVPTHNKVRVLLLLVATQGTQLSQDKRERLVHAMGLGGQENTMCEALQFFNVQVTKVKGSSSKGAGRAAGGTDEEGLDLSRYVPRVQTLLEDLAAGNLSDRDFPYASKPKASGVGAGAGSTSAGKSLRAAPRFAAALGRGNSSSDRTLELPNEAPISLKSADKFVVFIIGGVTGSEMRAAYKVTKAMNVEVAIGGTCITTPEEFVQQLAVLQ